MNSGIKSWNDLIEESNESVKGFAPLEPGFYNFVLTDAPKVGQTGKGLPKFSINPSVESGPREKGRIWHDFNVTESAWANKKFFFEPMEALGLTIDFFKANPSPEQIGQSLQGRRFVAEVYLEAGSDGVERPRLRSFSPPVGAPPAGAQSGVPGGLPTAAGPAVPTPQAAPAPAVQNAAPVAPQAVQQAAPASPWDTAPQAPAAPAAPGFNNAVPLPPPFGANQ